MKIHLLIPVLLVAATGCNSVPAEAPQPQSDAPEPKPVALTPQQELAKFCRVCVVDKGEKMPEFLPTRLEVKRAGQSYKFCSDVCRKKFDGQEKRYLLKTGQPK
jgi:hypothetical protein